MKYLALTIVAVGILSSQVRSQCPPIYDAINTATSVSYYGGRGSELMGDNYFPTPPPAGFNWSICTIEFIMIDITGGNCNATLNLYDAVFPPPPPNTPAFWDFRTSIGPFPVNTPLLPSSPLPQVYLITLGSLAAPLNICIPPPSAFGLGFEVNFDCPGQKTVGIANCGSIAGSIPTNGFYIDINQNAMLENSEQFTLGSFPQVWGVMATVTAQPTTCTPLPASFFGGQAHPEFKIEPLNIPVSQLTSLQRTNRNVSVSSLLRSLKAKQPLLYGR